MNNTLIVAKLVALITLGCHEFERLNLTYGNLTVVEDGCSFSQSQAARIYPDTRSTDEIATELELQARCARKQAVKERAQDAKDKKCDAAFKELKKAIYP